MEKCAPQQKECEVHDAVSELHDEFLALIGGGIGDVILG